MAGMQFTGVNLLPMLRIISLHAFQLEIFEIRSTARAGIYATPQTTEGNKWVNVSTTNEPNRGTMNKLDLLQSQFALTLRSPIDDNYDLYHAVCSCERHSCTAALNKATHLSLGVYITTV